MTTITRQKPTKEPAGPQERGGGFDWRAVPPVSWVAAYTRWLHTRWPAGQPERLPIADEHGRTNVDGLYIVGDLTGVPLLKLSANAGVEAVRRVADDLGDDKGGGDDETLDLAIVGGGTSGFSAALEAEKLGLRYCVFEASKPFNTIKDFPAKKPIYLYPTERPIEGELRLTDRADVKEGLVEELEEQTTGKNLNWVNGRVSHVERSGGALGVVCPDGVEKPEHADLDGTGFVVGEGERKVRAKRVIVGIGRSGNYRALGVPGEDKAEKVSHRLHDPADYEGKKVLIVGGGDSAMEAAIALTKAGADVTLSYRKKEFNRPKPENQEQILALADNPEAEASVEKPEDARQSTGADEWMGDGGQKGGLRLLMPSNVAEIRDGEVDVELDGGGTETVENDQVFLMIGREPPLDFFRKSGVRIRGERTTFWWASLIAFLVFCVWLYHWKAGKPLFGINGLALPAWLVWNPSAMWDWLLGLVPAPMASYFAADATLGGVLVNALGSKSFYYTFAYSACVVIFGIDRIMRRKTPYVKVQTLTLMAFQVLPLFLLPEIVLPYLGANGWFDGGPMGWIADQLFPKPDPTGDYREYWRAYGLVLAWPLMAWNWFTDTPIWGWLIVGFAQTFVLIPLLVYFLGKGAYCGWICSCGALAETLGDRHREKMPHGPFWNRFNMVGQALLLFAFVILAFRFAGWLAAGKLIEGVEVPWLMWTDDVYVWLGNTLPLLSWAWFVDILWAGIIGVGLYFWFSGRVWCRFACPLAALMHIYHRFGRFAILAEKKKCISCNVCTSVCHQGIDVMSFANKGRPMKDPQCVRCSACVQMCPTGVLSFGQVDRRGNTIGQDTLMASPVRMSEVRLTVNGKQV